MKFCSPLLIAFFREFLISPLIRLNWKVDLQIEWNGKRNKNAAQKFNVKHFVAISICVHSTVDG